MSKLVVGACAAYSALVLAFLIARALREPEPPFVALVSAFLPFLFLPLLVAVPLAILIRSRAASIATGVVTVLFVVLYADFFVPAVHIRRAQASSSIRVMNFNLGPAQSSPVELVKAIHQADADVVAVQELTPSLVDLFRDELSEEYPYVVLDSDTESIGLLSRHRILTSRWQRPAHGGRSYLRAQILWRDQTIDIVVVHPMPPDVDWHSRYRIPLGLRHDDAPGTVDEIAEWARSTGGLTIVAGDFSITDQTPAYARMRGVLHDSFREAGEGFGFTFPNELLLDGRAVPGPFVRLNYIFHSDGMEARSARVECRGSSDHCYLLTELDGTGDADRNPDSHPW